MNLLHLAHKKNINSILKNGLLPSYIKMDTHWEAFKNHGLNKRYCVYTWNGETYNNTKFIKDMVYTKMFIHPRNDMFDEEKLIDFKKFGSHLFGNNSTYFLLKIKNPSDPLILNEFTHVQEPCDSNTSTTTIMDDRYAHNNKIIQISGQPILPIQIEIVEEINVRVYNNKKLGFSFRKF